MLDHIEEKSRIPIHYFGIDTIRFNFAEDFKSPYFDSFFNGLSLNSPVNNNIRFFDVSVQLIYSEMRNRKILQIVYLGDPIMHLEKVLDGGSVRTVSWVLTVYSAYFYISAINGLLLQIIRKYRNWMSVSRLDLCMDVLVSVNELWLCHRTKAQKKQVIQKADSIETFYLGPKAKNKNHFVRVYNKKLDSQKKGKFHLFLDYMDLDVVSRIEVQINSNSCRRLGIFPDHILSFLVQKNIFDTSLHAVFRYLCLNEQGTNFDAVFFPGEKSLMERKSKYEVMDELPYARTMLGYARRLHDLGFDPIRYLREHLVGLE